MSQPPNASSQPKPMTVGSLVRHKHLPNFPAGLVVEHFAWSPSSRGLHVKFLKPYANSFGPVLQFLSDRYSSWDRIS